MDKKEEKLGEALLKVALGFQIAEVTEEYAEVDGELKLTKRKRTKKDVPPDLKAMQLLLGENGGTISVMSDEELEMEKRRLLALIAKEEEGQVCDESKIKTVKTAKPRGKTRKKAVTKKKTEDRK